LLNHVLEKKDDDRAKFCTFVSSLNGTSAGQLLSSDEALRGVLLFLNDLDEIAIDVPRAETYFAGILTSIILEGIISLNFMGNIPDENNFSFSNRRHTLLGDVLGRLHKVWGPVETEAAYKACGVPLRDLVVQFKGPREVNKWLFPYVSVSDALLNRVIRRLTRQRLIVSLRPTRSHLNFKHSGRMP
jgi:hypothetical protein